MRKGAGVLAALIILGVGYTGGTWYLGKRAQSAIEQAVAQANQKVAQARGPDAGAEDVKLVISQYTRGVFSSDVVYTLQFKDDAGERIELLLGDHLQHGPFPLDALKNGQLAPVLAISHSALMPSEAAQAWFDSLDGQSPITGVSRLKFAGDAESAWKFKPLVLQDEQQSLEFSGGEVQVKFSHDFADSELSGTFGVLDYADRETGKRLRIDGIQFTSNTRGEGSTAAVQSDGHASASRLAIETPEAGLLALEQLRVDLRAVRDADLLDAKLHYEFGKVINAQADLGGISLTARVDRLDVEAMSALLQAYGAIYARSPDGTTIHPAEAQALTEKLVAVLGTEPVVALDQIVWTNGGGESSAAVEIALQSPAAESSVLSLDELLTRAIKAVSLDVDVSRGMFGTAYAQYDTGQAGNDQATLAGLALFDHYVRRLRQAGLVQAAETGTSDGQEDGAKVRLRYQDHEVDLNGTSMSIAELFQRGLMALL